MPHASTEVIDLDSSEDEAPVAQAPIIDLTLESDEERNVATNGDSIPTPPAVIPPRSTAVDSINKAQPSRSPSVEASSHSDTSPVKRKPRKKRSFKNPDVDLRIRSPSPPREQRRQAHAKRASNASTGLDDDDEPVIRKPSFIAKPGLKAMQRLKIGTKAPSGSSAPKLDSRSTKARKSNDAITPKKKTATVKKVLNATLESLVPTVPESSRANRRVSVDKYSAFFQDDDEDSPELDYNPPPTPPPLTPGPNNVATAEPRRINPDYEPYSPTAASRGAGSTLHVDWYVNLPHSGWHSQSATAHPYLPPVPSRPATSTSTSFPSTDERPKSASTSANVSRKRKSRIITSDESDSSQPAPVKKRKYSLDEEEDNDLHLSTSLDRILDAVSDRSPDVAMADVGPAAVVEDEDLLEPDEEIDQLESSPEPATAPVLSPPQRKRREFSDRPASPPSMYMEEEVSMDFGGFDDMNMDETIIAPVREAVPVRQPDPPTVHMEEDWDGTVVNLNNDADEESETEGPRPYLDRAERERKKLLDEFSDVLDQHPEFTRGYRRPGISPANAPWVVLAPLLRRKLELERIKLRKFEYGE